MRTLLAFIFVALIPVGLCADESLAETAEKEKARRANQKGKPAEVYTNDNLPSTDEKKAAESKGAKGKKAKPTPTPLANSTPSSREDSEPSAEKQWRVRMSGCQAAVAAAEAKLAKLKEELSTVAMPIAAASDLDVELRQKAREGELRQQVEAAEKAVEAAKKALADLEEEARKKNVPPGWIR